MTGVRKFLAGVVFAVLTAGSAFAQQSPLTVDTIGLAANPGQLRNLTTAVDGQRVIARGFYVANDNGGGPFTWDAGCTAPDNGGTVIRPSGMTQGCFRRDFNGHTYESDWFGARPDGIATNPSPTDNLPRVLAAIAAMPTAVAATIGSDLDFSCGQGTYYFSGPLVLPKAVRIRGCGPAPLGMGTRFTFPAGSAGIVVGANANYSQIDNIALLGIRANVSHPADQYNGDGIYATAHLKITNSFVSHFEGDGVHYRAATVGDAVSTDASDFFISYTWLYQNGHDGLHMEKNDASQGIAIGVKATGNQCWGINDEGFLGNGFYECHTDSNGPLTGGVCSTRTVYKDTLRTQPVTGGAFKNVKTGDYCGIGSTIQTTNVGFYSEGSQFECYGSASIVLGGTHGSPVFGSPNALFSSGAQLTLHPNALDTPTVRWIGDVDSSGTPRGSYHMTVQRDKNGPYQLYLTNQGGMWLGSDAPTNADSYAGSGVVPGLGTLIVDNGPLGATPPSTLQFHAQGYWAGQWRAYYNQGTGGNGRSREQVRLQTPWNNSGTARDTLICQAGVCWPGSFTTAERDAIPNKGPGARIWNSTISAAQEWDGAAWRTVQYLP